MVSVLDFPGDKLGHWRADADERKAAEERFKKELKAREEADREGRRGVMTQAQSDTFNSWFDARFAAAFAQAVAGERL